MKNKKHTYKYNPHTLSYEKVIVSVREKVKNISFTVAFGLVLGVVFLIIGFQVVDSPKEKSLKREIAQYKRQVKNLNERMNRADAVLKDLEERDDNLYRTIFEAEPIPSEVRNSGIGGVERYADLEGYDCSESLIATSRKIDDLTKRLYVESRSLDEIYGMARTKNERMAAIPAIMPVPKQRCKIVSGFGVRYHPILKSRRAHTGIDLAAHKGTPIYATGDGTVIAAGRNLKSLAGYGVVCVIDHGYGFQTLYAHMSDVKVRAGKKVKRGELIGYVGSTGLSQGSHLHYEVILNGKRVDPVYYFYNDLTPAEYEEVIDAAKQDNQVLS
ncbi:MAG: M23 family metallopeptidase [Bacteroidales bacterium]|nr:M23 family metallopeptidase [Bacteroidales bacterium]